MDQRIKEGLLGPFLRGAQQALLVIPIVTLQHVACNQPAPCSMDRTANNTPQSTSESLHDAYITPPLRGGWDKQTMPTISNDVSKQQGGSWSTQSRDCALSLVELGTNNRAHSNSPTSITAPLSAWDVVQKAAERLQESGNLPDQKACEEPTLYVTSFEYNQKKEKWEATKQAVKSRVSIDAHLAEQGQQGLHSSTVEVVEFDNTGIASRELNKKYVIKYPETPTDLIGEEEGECDVLPLAGEVFAYMLSKAMKLNLVPETRLAVVQDRQGPISFATMKPYIGNLKRREQLSEDALLQKLMGLLPGDIQHKEYKELLEQDTNDKRIQALKLFLFITGQWDQRQGNILVKNDGSPVAVDNEHILTPCHTVVKAESYETLRQEKTFIKGGYNAHLHSLGSQNNPMVLYGNTSRIEADKQALMHSEEERTAWLGLHGKTFTPDPQANATSHREAEEKIETPTKRGAELAGDPNTTVASFREALDNLSKLQAASLKNAYLEKALTGKRIVDWETWQKRVKDNPQPEADLQIMIFYIKDGQVYQHYPMEMSLYMTKCDADVLGKFVDSSFLESVRQARQDTVNQVSLLCDWMEHEGVEFGPGCEMGWQSDFDEKSDMYIPKEATHYPVRFLHEVDNLGKRLEGEVQERRDSAIRYFVKKSTPEELINQPQLRNYITDADALDDCSSSQSINHKNVGEYQHTEVL